MPDRHIPCVECAAGCCTQYIVYITGYDAWMISSGLHMDWNEFVTIVETEDQSTVTFKLVPGGPSYTMILDKQRPAGTPVQHSAQQPCIFLMRLPNGYGRCGIYPHRPQICRTYPAALGLDSVHLRADSPPCPPNGWNLALVDIPVWQRQAVYCRMEIEVYRYICAVWNKHLELYPAEYRPHDFFMFLHETYTRLAKVRAEYDIEAVLPYWLNELAPPLASYPPLCDALETLEPPTVTRDGDLWHRYVTGCASTILQTATLLHR